MIGILDFMHEEKYLRSPNAKEKYTKSFGFIIYLFLNYICCNFINK